MNWPEIVRTITDPNEPAPVIPDAEALPPADFDQRTLDAVDAVLAARVKSSGFRETAKTLNLAREAIRRELGGA